MSKDNFVYDPNYGRNFRICASGGVHFDGEACNCQHQPQVQKQGPYLCVRQEEGSADRAHRADVEGGVSGELTTGIRADVMSELEE